MDSDTGIWGICEKIATDHNCDRCGTEFVDCAAAIAAMIRSKANDTKRRHLSTNADVFSLSTNVEIVQRNENDGRIIKVDKGCSIYKDSYVRSLVTERGMADNVIRHARVLLDNMRCGRTWGGITDDLHNAIEDYDKLLRAYVGSTVGAWDSPWP